MNLNPKEVISKSREVGRFVSLSFVHILPDGMSDVTLHVMWDVMSYFMPDVMSDVVSNVMLDVMSDVTSDV